MFKQKSATQLNNKRRKQHSEFLDIWVNGTVVQSKAAELKHGHVYCNERGEAAVDVNTVITCLNESGFRRMLFDSTMVANTNESVTNSQE
ncbi:hypothetical protein T4D_13541 [Trichinella pseudospiralis]|uniref:Uncharacterized protein n=1 Tax=Trichinella pseudospiralis TaxID=6337 RepID=A0A0V1G1N4_TRIPS|nr:hypothetical protein T4D_13541 [Trichinella pseudospiralis]